jgi:hypothetical protein
MMLLAARLGTNKQNLVLFARQVVDVVQGIIQRRNGVFEVDDVNFVACTENEWLHFWVPETGLVAEVGAGLQQVAHAHLIA